MCMCVNNCINLLPITSYLRLEIVLIKFIFECKVWHLLLLSSAGGLWLLTLWWLIASLIAR